MMRRWFFTSCLLAAATGCASPRTARPAEPAVTTEPAAAVAAAPTKPGRSPGQDAYDEGYALAMAGDFSAALPLFRKATELDPQLAVGWFDLAGLSEQLGFEEEALVAMQRAVDAEPRFVQARIELASLTLGVRDDAAAALAHLRRALTETAPFVIDRYSAARSRGEALHKVAATYGAIGFIGATESIAHGAFSDPGAEPDRRAARVADTAQADIDVELVPTPELAAAIAELKRDAAAATTRPAAEAALRRHRALTSKVEGRHAVDRWMVWRQLAHLEIVAEQLEAAVTSLATAAEVAKRLPLVHWLDTTYARIAIEIKLGRLDAAMRGFDELAWLEYAAAYADGPAGEQRRSREALTDAAFAPLRSRAEFAAIVTEFRLR